MSLPVTKVQQQKIRDFWQWFENNQLKYQFLSDVEPHVKEQMMNELSGQLYQVCNALCHAIGVNNKTGKNTLMISVDGLKEYFPVVEEVVKAAPVLEDWDFMAFKPPHGKGITITIHGRKFDPSEIIFFPMESDEKPDNVALRVFYPDFTEENKELFYQVTYLLIDAIVGEKSAAMDIDYFDVAETPDDIDDYDFWRLEDIAEYIAEVKNER